MMVVVLRLRVRRSFALFCFFGFSCSLENRNEISIVNYTISKNPVEEFSQTFRDL